MPPAPVQSAVDFHRRYCPACEQVVGTQFKPGPGRRPDAKCPRCGSLERHRFFALLVAMLRPALGDVRLLLEVAPSPYSTRSLAAVGARHHLRLDIGYDARLVDVVGSLTEVPCAEGSVDLLVCYHVLEHIPDDAAAMAEIARVLSSRGLAIIQVPWRPGTVTDEDPSAPEDERLRRFGQRDHVRFYGDDFEDRLRAAGLAFDRVSPLGIVGERMVTMCKLIPDEPIWLVRRAEAGASAPGVAGQPTSLTAAFDQLLGQLSVTEAQLVTARGRVQRLRARVEELSAGREARLTPRRIAGGLRRRARRLVRR